MKKFGMSREQFEKGLISVTVDEYIHSILDKQIRIYQKRLIVNLEKNLVSWADDGLISPSLDKQFRITLKGLTRFYKNIEEIEKK